MASSLGLLALLSKYEDILSAYTFPDNNHLLNKESKKQELKDFSFTFVELPKFRQQLKKPVSEFTLEEKFYYFLDKAPSITPKDLKNLVGTDWVIQKAFHLLDRFYWPPTQLATYEKIEKINRDYINNMEGAM